MTQFGTNVDQNSSQHRMVEAEQKQTSERKRRLDVRDVFSLAAILLALVMTFIWIGFLGWLAYEAILG